MNQFTNVQLGGLFMIGLIIAFILCLIGYNMSRGSLREALAALWYIVTEIVKTAFIGVMVMGSMIAAAWGIGAVIRAIWSLFV